LKHSQFHADSKGKILIADDNPINLRLLETMLQKNGYTICTTTNGNEALTQVEICQPDLILLDIKMPDINGFEVCKQLKDNEKTKNIPVIFISAMGQTHNIVKGFKLGSIDYITKPFHIDEVLARVQTHITIQKMQKQMVEQNNRLMEENYNRICAEKELQKIKEELELRVEERTQELARMNKNLQSEILERKKAENETIKLQRQLQQAQKMEAIGALAGGIAHDFNNILSAIIGYGELIELLDTKQNDKMRYRIQQLLKAAYRARDLVRRILTLSRHQDQDKKPISLNHIVKEALQLLRASLPATISINDYCKHVESVIYADPTQIHQVVMNLGTNAAHAMSEKGGVLTVTLSHIEVNQQSHLDLISGSYVLLSVSDTGVGIKKELIGKIFNPYFTTKKAGVGTGLGLAVTQTIINNHGGLIVASSEYGKGSMFKVYFPLLPVESISTDSDLNQIIEHGFGTILFVDDEKPLVDFFKETFENLGYTVHSHVNSIDAWTLFSNSPDSFDIVITDQTMPHLTGLELSEKILSIRPDIPIVICTGYSEELTPEKIESIGIREWIEKPIGIKNLAEVIHRLINSKMT